MRLADTHCHLNFNAYQDDLEEVLERAWDAGVDRILVPGIDLESSREVLSLAEKHDRLYTAVGVHPNSAETWSKAGEETLYNLAQHPKVKAVGEIGLDYYHDRSTPDRQKDILKSQLTLAGELNLPVVLHVRNANNQDRSCIIDLLNILEVWHKEKNQKGSLGPHGVVHSFSGDSQEAQRTLSLGFYVGITGPVTFDNAHSLRQVVTSTPLANLLLETDGPFLTPHPHRGKRNEPAYVKFVAQQVARLKNQSLPEVAQKTTENADRLFHWR